MGIKKVWYNDKYKLLNASEKLLYEKLKEAAPALLVFTQVSMSQIFYMDNDESAIRRFKISEIGYKSVDFLLCRTDTSILLAIELNGPHHEREDRKKKDEEKANALKEAGIPLVIFKPGKIPDTEEIRKILAPHIMERHKNEANKKEEIQIAMSRKKGPPVEARAG